MRIRYTIWIVVAGLAGCVETYDFNLKNNRSSLVIDAEISNMSYNDYVSIPSDGRYFTVKLRRTSDVVNQRDKPVRNARVTLTDDGSGQWNYTGSESMPGLYTLFDMDFHVRQGTRYQLKVSLPDGETYYSDWERLPNVISDSIGAVDFEEFKKFQYVYRSEERVLTAVRAFSVRTVLPVNANTEPVYYRWNYLATWVYRAPLVRPTSSIYRCWITDPGYLPDYVLHRDFIGGYKKDLFTVNIDGNDRFFDRLSVLIRQYNMSEKYYSYWYDIRQQDQRNGLFDPPPYNLQSNLHAAEDGQKVYGYFGVVDEKAKRWNISSLDFTFPVENTWESDCDPRYRVIDVLSKCKNCLYANDYATIEKPDWWDR